MKKRTLLQIAVLADFVLRILHSCDSWPGASGGINSEAAQ